MHERRKEEKRDEQLSGQTFTDWDNPEDLRDEDEPEGYYDDDEDD